ncbi:MAG: hypothetical protein CMJ80_05840 [Planctomycetaceae bacterium]|jgi:chemotaxis signal transduction protein|nr:hypothetical protein [Planctomycetaceae bacterium]
MNGSLVETQPCEKYCVFERDSQVYGVLATSVQEVGLRPNIAPVPDSHPMLAGLGRVRNDFVPLLHAESQSTRTTRDSESQVVVMMGDHGPWGLLVDNVVGIVPLEVSLCSESHGTQGWSAAVMGAATTDGRVVQVLDERSLYRFSVSLFRQFWVSATAE